MAGMSGTAELWLERQSPTLGERAQSPAWRDLAAPGCVFLHGDGVAWACQAGHQAELLICSASWQRRFGRQPPASGVLASLMMFWTRSQASGRLISRDRQIDQWQGEPGRAAWQLRYLGDESALARREALELVMAGASLDLDITVLLDPAAWRSFEAEDWQGWQQLTDHQLACLQCLARADDPIPPGISWQPVATAPRSNQRSLWF